MLISLEMNSGINVTLLFLEISFEGVVFSSKHSPRSDCFIAIGNDYVPRRFQVFLLLFFSCAHISSCWKHGSHKCPLHAYNLRCETMNHYVFVTWLSLSLGDVAVLERLV